MVVIADHEGVDYSGYSKKINSQSCHLGAFILSHSEKLLNDVIIALDGFKNHKTYYSDTDSGYIQKNDYNTLKEKGLIRKKIFQSKNDYEDTGIVYGLLLAPKINFCIVIDDNGSLQQKNKFKVCDREMSQIGFKDFLNMEKGLIVQSTSKLKWKRDLLGVKVPIRVNNCENCQNDKMCRSCIKDPKLNCFGCEISRSRDNCLK